MAEVTFNDQPELQERESVQEPTLLQRTRQKLHNGAALLITAPFWFPVRNNEPQPAIDREQRGLQKSKLEKLRDIDAPVPHAAGPMFQEAQRAIVEPHHPIRQAVTAAIKTAVGIKTGHYQP